MNCFGFGLQITSHAWGSSMRGALETYDITKIITTLGPIIDRRRDDDMKKVPRHKGDEPKKKLGKCVRTV